MTKTEVLDNLAARQVDFDRYAAKPTTNPFRREAARSLREARLLVKAYA